MVICGRREEKRHLTDRTLHPEILRADSAALIVIDMQAPFVQSVQDSQLITENAANLVRGFQVLNIPVIGTTQYAMRMGDIIPEIRHALPPTPAHNKMVFDCCGAASFNAAVAQTGANQILICGVETHICVCQTALGLVAQGYQVHIAADATSSRSNSDCKIGLEKMYRAGVVPSSVEMALYEMVQEAGSLQFKQILELIK
jgi:nicotinamidase-related amidase